VAYREGNACRLAGRAEPVEELDSLAFPARELLPNRLYTSFDGGGMTCIITARGCPGSCAYCSVNQVGGSRCRRRSVGSVIAEMRECRARYATREFAFLDDTFTFDREWVMSFCGGLEASGLGRVRWSCLTRVDRVDAELLRRMKSAGCHRVEMGIESGSQRLLDRLGKGITIEQTRRAFSLAREAGLSAFAFVMLNVPGETRESLEETRRLVMDLSPDFLQVSFATPYPGTPLYAQCEREGTLETRDWSRYLFLNEVVMRNPCLPAEELLAWAAGFQRAFYLRPRYALSLARYAAAHPAGLFKVACSALNGLRRSLVRGKR
jgi:radical SAM superfamily enzyme YgiQ (UPF0313 family)